MEINLTNTDSESLAALVVVYRHLGMNKDLAIKCMNELYKRKIMGHTFDYELYINKKLKEMPPIQMDSKSKNILISLSKNDIKEL